MANLNCITTLSSAKVKSLCIAYESLLGITNTNLTTAPSIARNLKLLKATHSRVLLAETGYPTGGSYSLIQNLSISPLPELVPPSTGDFVSADDKKITNKISNIYLENTN